MGTLKNRHFRHPADSNPLIIQAPNLRKLYFSRCPVVLVRLSSDSNSMCAKIAVTRTPPIRISTDDISFAVVSAPTNK